MRLKPVAASRSTTRAAILKGLYYYRSTAAYVFLGVIAVGLLATLFIAPKYRSDARLLALTSDSYDVQSETTAAPRSEPFKPDDVVNLEMQLLSSEDLHRAALTRLGDAPKDPVAFERARQKFTDALSITRISGANVIALAFTDRDAARAKRGLDSLIAVYFDSRARMLTSGRVALLEQQFGSARTDLARANALLRDFQARYGIADIDAQIAGAVSVDTALRQQRSEAVSELSKAQTSIASLRKSAAGVPVTVELYRDDTEATHAVAELQGQLLQLQAKRADLAQRYMPGSPLITQADQQIAGLRAAIAGQRDLAVARRIGRNNYSDALQEQVRENGAAAAGEAAKHAQLQKEIAASSARLLSLNSIAGKISELKLQRDAAQDRYRLLANEIEQARAREVDAANGSTNVRVIQQPDFPTARSNSVHLMLAGAVVAAIILAAASMFARVMLRTRVLDADEAATSAGAPIVADLRDPADDYQDGLAGMGQLLLERRQAIDRVGCVVAIVGTCAEDYDWHLLSIVRELEGCNAGSAVLVYLSAAAYPSGDGRFAALVASLPSASRFEIGGGSRSLDEAAAQALAALREQYRWIVLLAPPMAGIVGSRADARGLTQLATVADQVLLIVQVERTRQDAAREAAEALDRLGPPLSGIIVTGERIKWPKFVVRD